MAKHELAKEHRQIAGYLGFAFLAYYICFPQGGLTDLFISFVCKDDLHLDATQTSLAKLIFTAPCYVAFLFGFLRDRWNPFGRGDRAIFLIFGFLAVVAYSWLATGDLTYQRLLIGGLAATVAYRFLAASTQGLAADVGKRRGMTGRITTLWTIVWNIFAGLSFVAGGFVSDHLSRSQTWTVLAVLTGIYVVLGLIKPAPVYEGDEDRLKEARPIWPEIKRIATHRPIWPAAIIWLLWSFAPGFFTPLTFYLSDTVKLSDTQAGLFYAIFSFAFIPAFLLYGFICRKTKLTKLLWWGTVVAVPQMFPLLFLKTPGQALFLAAPIGLMGGVATAAYIDLLMRSCPKGLEGTGMMLADTGYFIAVKFGDMFGAWLFKQGGFALAAWITIAVYVLILPMLLLVPKAITDYHDADEATEEALVEDAEPVAAGL